MVAAHLHPMHPAVPRALRSFCACGSFENPGFRADLCYRIIGSRGYISHLHAIYSRSRKRVFTTCGIFGKTVRLNDSGTTLEQACKCWHKRTGLTKN